MHLSIKNHFLESDVDREINKKRRRPSRNLSTTDVLPSQLLQMSFLIISFGYMLPWTSLGSLISYYKYRYSAEFYVKIYCAYYLPGLPVALVLYRFDEYWNSLYGSKVGYKWRGLGCFFVMIAVIVSLSWFDNEFVLIILFTLLGISSWFCHGTATMYAALFPSTAIAYLQIGFRSPEIYVITADHYLDLGKDATTARLNLFYKMTAVLVAISLICWVVHVESPASAQQFAEKDRRGRGEYDPEKSPLLSTSSESSSSEGETSRLIQNNQGNNNSSHSTAHGSGKDTEGNPFNRAKALLSAIETLAKQENDVFQTVSPLCAALFVTMWSSIFQASFFAYVDSVSSDSRNIEKTLYFIRLLCDLAGRPLALLTRPYFLAVSSI